MVGYGGSLSTLECIAFSFRHKRMTSGRGCSERSLHSVSLLVFLCLALNDWPWPSLSSWYKTFKEADHKKFFRTSLRHEKPPVSLECFTLAVSAGDVRQNDRPARRYAFSSKEDISCWIFSWRAWREVAQNPMPVNSRLATHSTTGISTSGWARLKQDIMKFN